MQDNGNTAVVPGYYLVCYNMASAISMLGAAVVPGYYLVCYNAAPLRLRLAQAVVPGYYLVCYNPYEDLEKAHQL